MVKIYESKVDTMMIVIGVNGMMCENCKKHVEKAIKRVKGVKNAKVSLENKNVTIKYSDKETNEEEIKKAILEAGYEAN